jgi:tetratricopeptide (TPR) repeat protein
MKKIICIFIFIYLAQRNPLKAQNNIIDSLNHILQNEKKDTVRCLVMEQLAFQYQLSNPDIALVLAEQGMNLSRKIKYLRGDVKCLSRIGTIYSITGNGTRGLELILQALKSSEQLSDPGLKCEILRLAGDVYSDLGDSRKSLEYDFRALDMATVMQNDVQQANCMSDIGDSYEKLNELDSAKIFTQAAYELAQQKHYPDLMGVSLNNLGNIYSKRHEPASAMNYYRKSIPYQQAARDEEGICETLLGMATQFRQLGMEDSCIYYAKQSYISTKNNGFTVYLLRASNFIADYYKQYHQVDSAYKYLLAVVDAKDSMFSQEKIRQVQRLSFEETLRQQEKAAEERKAKESHVRNLQLLAIAVFIPVFFLTVLLLGRTKVKPRVVEFLGILSLLLFFEFITDLIYPYVSELTNENPIWEMSILVILAAVLEPLNFKLEHWVKSHLVHKPAVVPLPLQVESFPDESKPE